MIKMGCISEALLLMNIKKENKKNYLKSQKLKIAKRSFKGREP
jgi:hypothetical protein